jgi:oligoendopeptidase F
MKNQGATMPQISLDKIRWDLTSLYADLDDEKLQSDLSAAHQLAEQFRDAFHGKINRPEINPASFSKALKEYQTLQLIVLKPYLFAQLLFYSERVTQGIPLSWPGCVKPGRRFTS